MGATKAILPTTALLKFHLSFLLSEATTEKLDFNSWAEARLISATSIEISFGHRAEVVEVISCFELEALHAVTQGPTSQGAASICCFVADGRSQGTAQTSSCWSCCSSQRSSITPPMCTVVAAASAGPAAAAEVVRLARGRSKAVHLWAEVEIKVWPTAHIWAESLTLRPAWRLLLPRLARYTREEAPTMASSTSPLRLTEKAATTATPTPTSGYRINIGINSTADARDGKQTRALDAVYASLKPRIVETLAVEDGEQSSAVGPGPGASGLNALPAAVVVKGKCLLNMYWTTTCINIHINIRVIRV